MTTPEKNTTEPAAPIGYNQEQHEVFLENADIDDIHGDIIHAHASTIDHIVTEEANLESSSANFIDATTIKADETMIGNAHAETMEIHNSDIGMINSGSATLSGNLGAIFSQAVTMNQSQAGVIVAREMQGDKIQAVILVAARVNGPVETKLDTRNALLFGAVAGAIIGIVVSVIRLMMKR